MKTILLVLAAITTLLAPVSPAAAQLYGDPKDVTSGELNDQDYWWARYDDMMLDLALKQHQPAGSIGLELATMERRLDDLAKKYPKHGEIKTLKAHADSVLKTIDPNADRHAGFAPECPWDEANFAQIWVNMHWAKASLEEKDYQNVQGLMQNVNSNLDIMLAPDRMKSYPPELSKFVLDARPEAARMTKLAHDKLTVTSGPEVKADNSVTTGDLDNQDYWWARYDDMMLDLAVKERQPEGRIDYMLASALQRLDALAAKYPRHDGIQQMKRHAQSIKDKIDPKADRTKPFTPEVPWEEANFAQLWVNLHHAQAAHKMSDDNTAAGLISNIRQNLDILLKPNRMDHYPADLRKWVEDAKDETDTLAAQVKSAKSRSVR